MLTIARPAWARRPGRGKDLLLWIGPARSRRILEPLEIDDAVQAPGPSFIEMPPSATPRRCR